MNRKSPYITPPQAYALLKEGKVKLTEHDNPKQLLLPNGHHNALRVTRSAALKASKEKPVYPCGPWLLSDLFR